MIVLDASAVIALLLRTEGAEAVQSEIGMRNQTLHAPHLLDVEVARVTLDARLARASGHSADIRLVRVWRPVRVRPRRPARAARRPSRARCRYSTRTAGFLGSSCSR